LKIALIVIVLIYTSANTNSTRLGLLIDFRFTGNRFWNRKPVSKYRNR